jgi:isoquinoline 1-oxidoreductase beta subunit
MQHDVYRPHYVNQLVARLDANGVAIAFFDRVAAPSILARWAAAWFQKGIDTDTVEGAAQERLQAASLWRLEQ